MDTQKDRFGPGTRSVLVENADRWGDGAVQALELLSAIGRELTGDVRIVVLDFPAPTTASDTSIADGSLGALMRRSEADRDRVLANHQDGVAWLRRADTVTVATVRGRLTGPATELALGCDLRLLAHDASFAFTAPPLLGGSERLAALIGTVRAAELALTGRPVAAAEAERLGLATRVVPASDLDAAATDLVAGLLAVDRTTLIETKALYANPSLAAERESFARLAGEPGLG